MRLTDEPHKNWCCRQKCMIVLKLSISFAADHVIDFFGKCWTKREVCPSNGGGGVDASFTVPRHSTNGVRMRQCANPTCRYYFPSTLPLESTDPTAFHQPPAPPHCCRAISPSTAEKSAGGASGFLSFSAATATGRRAIQSLRKLSASARRHYHCITPGSVLNPAARNSPKSSNTAVAAAVFLDSNPILRSAPTAASVGAASSSTVLKRSSDHSDSRLRRSVFGRARPSSAQDRLVD